MIPILNNVVVKPLMSDNISEGGIVLPESIQQRNNRATIVSRGTGTNKFKLNFPDGIGIGDDCIHVKDAGVEVLINNEKHYIIKSQDILAFIKK